jgi:hypothetical protein
VPSTRTGIAAAVIVAGLLALAAGPAAARGSVGVFIGARPPVYYVPPPPPVYYGPPPPRWSYPPPAYYAPAPPVPRPYFAPPPTYRYWPY